MVGAHEIASGTSAVGMQRSRKSVDKFAKRTYIEHVFLARNGKCISEEANAREALAIPR